MLSKIRQLRRILPGISLVGDGMLVRLRSTSIALLGLVAAVGLGLIAFIAQLGFPGVFSGPIPGHSSEAGTIHDAIALTHRPSVVPAPVFRGTGPVSGSSSHGSHVARPAAEVGVGGSRDLAESPGAQPSPAVAAPPPAPATEPVSQPPPAPPVSSPAPSPAPTPAAESPSKSAAGEGTSKEQSTGKSKPKSSGTAAAKTTSDGSGGKPESSSTGGSKSDGVGKATAQSGSRSKSNGYSPNKPAEDQAASSPKPPLPPPTEPAAKAPEAVPPAAAKEAADAGKSDKSHH